MEQFREIGEVLGSIKALMVLRDDIRINQRQCCFLLDIFRLAYKVIAEGIRENLRLDERNTKWKALEQPLKELHKVFKDGEFYIRRCFDYRDWWGKVISLHQNQDCVEFHVHNLFCCFPIVIEAIDAAGEISGLDQEEMQKRKFALAKKCEREWCEPRLFQWKFGNRYLVSREICHKLGIVWREDRWLLLEAIKERKLSSGSAALTKHEHKIGDLLLKKLGGEDGKLFPSSILVGSNDYQVRRRLGCGNQYKEIQWLGENFAMRHFFGEIGHLTSEISAILSLAHPNVIQYLCGFYDEDKKECFLLMELMSKDLCSHIKEICGPRRRAPPFSLPVIVDLMLQIARGMEYLHSSKVYHGDLNSSNVLLEARDLSGDVCFHAKVSSFGLPCVKNPLHRSSQHQNTETNNSWIWYAPEVLTEQEQPGTISTFKYTEKADVYSFGMLCFQLLTGKVPFEDSRLHGEKPSRNLRAGERPLFPFPTPKYLVNLTRKCWQTEPSQRPTFSSICRMLRYIKRFLVVHADADQEEFPSPPVDCIDIEGWFLKKFPLEAGANFSPVSRIPFQMFAYKLAEKEKCSGSPGDKNWEISICGGMENASVMDELFPSAIEDASACFEIPENKVTVTKKASHVKAKTSAGKPKGPSPKRKTSPKSSSLHPCRNLRFSPLHPMMSSSPRCSPLHPMMSSSPRCSPLHPSLRSAAPLQSSHGQKLPKERKLPLVTSTTRSKKQGHVSDSESS